MSPSRHQAIIWTNIRILLIGPLGTNFSEISIVYSFIQENAFENVAGTILSWPQCVNSLWPSDAIWRQEIWVSIGSGNGLFPDGTKPLPEPMLTDHQWSPVTFIWGQFQEIPQPSTTRISLKMTYLKFHLNLPGASELTNDDPVNRQSSPSIMK